jgi:outer membrane protein
MRQSIRAASLRAAGNDMKRHSYWRSGTLAVSLLTVSGCADLQSLHLAHPSVAPVTQSAASLNVDASRITPMYHQLLAIDLPTVGRVAMTRNLDIKQARQRLAASRGQYESSVAAIFPVVAPSITGSHLNGVGQNANGTLALANFTNFMPGISINWILNPGQVAYDIIASKRRLEAADQQEQAVTQDTMRIAAVQYYDLVLAQAQVSVTRQAIEEAGELLRIERLRLEAGTGLPADELRAEAALANAQQDLVTELNDFYEASVRLAVTLHLAATIMLVPQTGAMKQTGLVRDDLSITEMLATAARYRPDLGAVRKLLQAAQADKGATIWGELGPQFQASYSFAGLAAHTTGQDDALHEQQRAAGTAGFSLGASTYGQINTANANRNAAGLNVESQIDQIRAEVVSAHQASLTAAKLIPIADQQVNFAEEALRLTQENLKSGTGLTVDVLQAQAIADQARYRYATAVVRYNQSEVNLLAALGLIDPSSLLPFRTGSPPAPERPRDGK